MAIILMKIKNNLSLFIIGTLYLDLRPFEKISFQPLQKVAGVALV